MKNGQCPKCGGSDIRIMDNKFTQRGLVKGRAFGTPLHVSDYVCMNCRYLESYIADQDAYRFSEDAEAQNWPRVDVS